MRKSLVLASFLALVGCAGAPLAARAASKVGTVDLQRALQEVKKGKEAKGTLEKELGDKKKKIETEQESIRKASEEFQKKGAVMSEKARNEKGAELQKRMAGWQEMVSQTQQDLQRREAELTRPIIEGIRTIIPEVSRKRDLDLVLEVNSVLYALDKTDVTEELIKIYDERNK